MKLNKLVNIDISYTLWYNEENGAGKPQNTTGIPHQDMFVNKEGVMKMEEKMTFKLTEEQAKLIRNALAIAADTYKDKEKQDKAEELHELFRRRLADRNFNKGE